MIGLKAHALAVGTAGLRIEARPALSRGIALSFPDRRQ